MNPEIKAEWIADLRSGNYVQGRGCLRNAADKMCCLGVLMEQAVRKGVIPEPSLHEGKYWYHQNDCTLDCPGNFQTDVLSGEVMKWAGLPEDSPDVDLGEENEPNQTLVHLNDQQEYSFHAIADIIEEQL